MGNQAENSAQASERSSRAAVAPRARAQAPVTLSNRPQSALFHLNNPNMCVRHISSGSQRGVREGGLRSGIRLQLLLSGTKEDA